MFFSSLKMIKRFFMFVMIFSLPVFCDDSYQLKSINFFQESDVSKIELTFDKQVNKITKHQVTEDKQILLDLKNTSALPKVMRAFDTSEFSGSVVFVSPYVRPETPGDIRLAVQLRDNVRSIVEYMGEKVVISIENRFGVFSKQTLDSNSSNMSALSGLKSEAQNRSIIRVPKSDSVEDILENLTLSGIKRYVGKKISFNVKNISIVDLLKMIADSSGFNIIISDEVKSIPPTSLTLTNIPWDQALDTVLSIAKLNAIKNGNILIISSLEKAAAEAKLAAESKEGDEKKIPLVTKIFPISFAKTDDIRNLLAPYTTKDRGAISVDQRTNSLIVKDTADVIEKMRKIIETLDTQTPQILIESKIVEATESFSRDIGLVDGLNFGYDPFTDITTTPPTPSGSFSFSSAPLTGSGGRDLLQVSIINYRRLLALDFRFQMMENESKGKVISNPRIITENKKTATISTNETTSFSTSTTNNGATTSSFTNVSATMNLTVTPQVTNDGSILLEVGLSKSSFGARPSPQAPPDTTTRSLATNVLVENGSTIVLGGIYNFTKSESETGIPLMKDLPLVGWLFKTSYNPSTSKNELIIFITPRIINQEEAGLVDKSKAEI
jgi:type IV pilus assembly protein PilQ